MSSRNPILWVIFAGVVLGLAYFLFRVARPGSARSVRVAEWIRNRSAHPDWAVKAGTRCVPQATMLMPTDGLIGYLWDDSFQAGKRHQGIDIFAGTGVGKTPVVNAYPGYLTRLPDWKSAVIVRVPADPLAPGRQIWLYYTHMADPDGNSFISSEYPAGTTEKFVEAGTRLGYQGNYTGDAVNPTGVHLHFSIVQDDGKGKFLNELDIRNTLDPSPYLGLSLNARTSDGGTAHLPPGSPVGDGMTDFSGKIVLITGAGKGTGRRVAEAFASRGATLAVNDVSPVNLDETVAKILSSGGQVKSYVEDIAKKMPIQTLLNEVIDDFGRIDILVNCAEVEPQKSVLEMDDWDWQRTQDVNLNGAFLLTQSVGRIMKEKGGGVIVHVGETSQGTRRAGQPTFRARPAWQRCPRWQLMNCPSLASGSITSSRIRSTMQPSRSWSCADRNDRPIARPAAGIA